MLGSPRIVAVDDQLEHLTGLADCLNRSGVACLRVHFTGQTAVIPACPDVRIIFADLHLVPGPPLDPKTDFARLGGLIQTTIKPVGPYFIVLWTEYHDQAEALLAYLTESELRGVTKPFAVRPLPKSDHLSPDGSIKSTSKLIKAVDEIVRGLPQVGALFDWEGRVLGAAGRTVSSILDLTSDGGGEDRAKEVGGILDRLAAAAVGRVHVDEDRFRAVNDALLPILADRVAQMAPGQIDQDLWRAALTIPAAAGSPSEDESARLNRLIHIADSRGTSATTRGAVIPLPDSYRAGFLDRFGITELDAATKRFRCKKFDPSSSRFRWVLVQCQAACDYALSNPGSVPYYLGLDFPQEHRSSKNPPQSTWRGPMFEFNGVIRRLRVNAGFPLALPASETRDVAPLYRLREQMLNDLLYHVHSHGARPGMMSFGGP